MPQQGYSVGRDTSVVITLPNGTNLSLDKVTSFDAKPESSKSKIKGLDGVTDNLRSFEGWNLTIKNERRSSTLDALYANLEANYYAGKNEDYCTVQQTIREPNGTISQFRFERVMFDFDPGSWESDKSVSQTLTGAAARRVKQA